MKTVEEVRRERLRMLRDEFGTLAALNDKLGLDKRDSTLSQYLNQSTGSKTSKPKVMGSPMARRLEQVCGKEVGWMDTDPQLQASADAYQAIAAQVHLTRQEAEALADVRADGHRKSTPASRKRSA